MEKVVLLSAVPPVQFMGWSRTKKPRSSTIAKIAAAFRKAPTDSITLNRGRENHAAIAHGIYESLPDYHRELLTGFFRKLIKADHPKQKGDAFGFTLFGDKPVTFTRAPKSITEHEWQAFQYYLPTLEQGNYRLLLDRFPNRYGQQNFTVINLKNLRATIEKHQETIIQRLGKPLNADVLVKEMSAFGNFLEYWKGELQGDSLVLGILLGYGLNNAKAFERGLNELEAPDSTIAIEEFSIGNYREALSGKWEGHYFRANPDIKPSEGFKTSQEELNHLIRQFPINRGVTISGNNGEEHWLDTEESDRYGQNGVFVPIFRALVEDPETDRIIDSFAKTERLLAELCDKPPREFLESILTRLMTDSTP